MLTSIRSFVRAAISPETSDEDQRVGIQMAATLLLLEVAAADFEEQPEERVAIRSALQKAFDLNMETIESLLTEAEQQHDAATSLFEYTRILNEQCDQQQKFEILIQLWSVAFADGSIDKYEDHRIRRIADLLYLSHREFIQAKHLAQQKGS